MKLKEFQSNVLITGQVSPFTLEALEWYYSSLYNNTETTENTVGSYCTFVLEDRLSEPILCMNLFGKNIKQEKGIMVAIKTS